MILKLCLLCMAGAFGAVHTGPIRKSRKMEDRGAPVEEVNVLMFGIIQLGESLSHVHESTEKKIARIVQTLKSHEGTLQNLEEKAEEAVEVEKEMKVVIELLQERMIEQDAQTRISRDLLTAVEKEEVGVNAKVKKLQMRLDNYVPLDLRELQERVEEHSFVLKGLEDITQFQKQIIEAREEQISKLEEMSEDVPLSFSDEF